ncbi:inositol hexakisphosphate and diphosphoinositol-pentakisphosphate kinase [Trichonephila clavata]|uniref:Inositol hexakisphosphate and diphosphoinositol-pentakisphosphate kinase n=1 Tax=Trichonephila clavata TaxID=2740835 RepID=A0A8X6H3H5_TRICU|nr:inositol hexakisphosphate and diphosphoinositol-pentakisphosphate kinase [Trichonephila clavata]
MGVQSSSMSYTELEQGYQGLKQSRPFFYIGEDDFTSSNRTLKDYEREDEGKQVLVGICAMEKKSQSKPMKEILTRLEEFEYLKTVVFPEDVILNEPVEKWPVCDCLISFHSKGFPLAKAIDYANLRKPFIINDLFMQYDIQDRRKVYSILENEGIELPRYAVLDRESEHPSEEKTYEELVKVTELVESEDHVEVDGVIFNKPFVEKPISAEDHNIYIYYPTSAGGGSQRLFRKIGSRSSVYSPESRVRKSGSFIYEEFMPTDGTDVKVYTVGPDYAHAEARKSPALDGKVERDKEGKEVRYPVILSNAEKLIARKVCLAFKQTVCGFDLLRANGKSYVCDVNGFSFVKNSMKYYDDCSKILGNMILRELTSQLHIPWSMPFQLDDPPIVPTTFGKMMELRCVIAVIRHGDRTPKQKMKMEVKHYKFFEIFQKYGGYKDGHVKLKKPKQLQEILDISRFLLNEIELKPELEIEENKAKLEQLKAVLEMYGHFSGINRKVQLKYQPQGRPRRSSSDEDTPREPSLVLILKWGGELTPAGRVQAEELGRVFRCMYPGGQGEYAGTQGLGLLRLHSTYRHDLKIYASDEGRVQMTAAAFAKGLLALEGELTPILVQMVKSANTNGLLDNDCDSSNYQNMVKQRLHETLQIDQEFTEEDYERLNPTKARSIHNALQFIKNPVRACEHVHELLQEINQLIKRKKEDPRLQEAPLYHGETWDLMQRRWSKLEKDFQLKTGRFDISKVPDIYDCIKYDLQHNHHNLQFPRAQELYVYAKALADIVIPQEYGINQQEKLTIGLGICTPLLKKIRADLHRNIDPEGDETENVNRLNPIYSHGVSSPERHVRTRLYFTSESHIHSLLTVLRYGGLLDWPEPCLLCSCLPEDTQDEQWRRAMEYVSAVSELNYMTQVVIMLYEDPTKDISSEERFHVELHFSPGVVCCVQKNLPPGPGFRPQTRSGPKERLNCPALTLTGDRHCSVIDCEKHARIDEEEDDLTLEEEINCPSDPDSPTILEENDLKEEKKFILGRNKPSEPIPIQRTTTKVTTSLPHKPCVMMKSSSDTPRPRSLDSENNKVSKTEKGSPHTQSLEDVSVNNKMSQERRESFQHRHSIPGQLSSYLRMCSAADLPKVYGSTNSLFSTAVISGSSSAPELKNAVPPSAEGLCNVPTIRPLETLHNALSLRQLDSFLERMTSPTFRVSLQSLCKLPSSASSGNSSSSSQPSALPIVSPSNNNPLPAEKKNVWLILWVKEGQTVADYCFGKRQASAKQNALLHSDATSRFKIETGFILIKRDVNLLVTTITLFRMSLSLLASYTRPLKRRCECSQARYLGDNASGSMKHCDNETFWNNGPILPGMSFRAYLLAHLVIDPVESGKSSASHTILLPLALVDCVFTGPAWRP